jgi:hypothetical protein
MSDPLPMVYRCPLNHAHDTLRYDMIFGLPTLTLR